MEIQKPYTDPAAIHVLIERLDSKAIAGRMALVQAELEALNVLHKAACAKERRLALHRQRGQSQ
jgi:hypothetical protein